MESFVRFALHSTKGSLAVVFVTDRKSRESAEAYMRVLLAPRVGSFAIYRDCSTLSNLISPGILAL